MNYFIADGKSHWNVIAINNVCKSSNFIVETNDREILRALRDFYHRTA